MIQKSEVKDLLTSSVGTRTTPLKYGVLVLKTLALTFWLMLPPEFNT